jgi:hypothetical protein
VVKAMKKDPVELADLVAQDLVTYAHRAGMDPVQILKTAVLVERLIMRTFPGPEEVARATVLEAHAIFQALTTPVMAIDQN